MRATRGFSILELLIAIVVLGIMSAISMSMLRSDRIAVQQAATILVGQISRTRLEAIKNNENTGIWFSGGYTVTVDDSGSYSYSINPGGYKICVDANRDSSCSSTETTIHSVNYGQGDLAKVRILSSGSSPVIFNSRGIAVQGDVYVFLSNKDWSSYKIIHINAQGRASIL